MQSPLSFGKATGYARASQVALPAAAVPAQVLGQQPQGAALAWLSAGPTPSGIAPCCRWHECPPWFLLSCSSCSYLNLFFYFIIFFRLFKNSSGPPAHWMHLARESEIGWDFGMFGVSFLGCTRKLCLLLLVEVRSLKSPRALAPALSFWFGFCVWLRVRHLGLRFFFWFSLLRWRRYSHCCSSLPCQQVTQPLLFEVSVAADVTQNLHLASEAAKPPGVYASCRLEAISSGLLAPLPIEIDGWMHLAHQSWVPLALTKALADTHHQMLQYSHIVASLILCFLGIATCLTSLSCWVIQREEVQLRAIEWNK